MCLQFTSQSVISHCLPYVLAGSVPAVRVLLQTELQLCESNTIQAVRERAVSDLRISTCIIIFIVSPSCESQYFPCIRAGEFHAVLVVRT
jgi:hypothetical protein